MTDHEKAIQADSIVKGRHYTQMAYAELRFVYHLITGETITRSCLNTIRSTWEKINLFILQNK